MNGWKNWETWNVALWIGNDEGLYSLAKDCRSYKEFQCSISNLSSETPDGASWIHEDLDIEALDEMIEEL